MRGTREEKILSTMIQAAVHKLDRGQGGAGCSEG
jgi:hypothetical protein